MSTFFLTHNLLKVKETHIIKFNRCNYVQQWFENALKREFKNKYTFKYIKNEENERGPSSFLLDPPARVPACACWKKEDMILPMKKETS